MEKIRFESGVERRWKIVIKMMMMRVAQSNISLEATPNG